MTVTTTSNYLATFLTVMLLTSITTGESTPAAFPPSNGGCADSVIAFSPCLPYISAPPNDIYADPTPQCCDVFTEAFDSGEAECLCYLVRQTTLLGFPINASKILSLSDLCSSGTNSTTSSSIQSVCSESPTLPPLINPRPPPPPSRSVSDARHSPPPPYLPPSPPPPSAITSPRPANNASVQSSTKPSTSEQSSNPTDLALTTVVTLIAVYLLFLVRVPVFIFDQYRAGMEH